MSFAFLLLAKCGQNKVQNFSGTKSLLCSLLYRKCNFHFNSCAFCDPQHWGLLCFDVGKKSIYFDDGLKISLPHDALCAIQNVLSSFRVLSGNVSEHEDHWTNTCLSLPMPRLNMRIQPRSGIGAGSCGVGVILAIRDIIESQNCLPSFKWTFGNVANLRKELMAGSYP